MSATQPQTVIEQNKHLVLRWFNEVWNQEHHDTINELYAENCVLHDGSRTLRGREAFFEFHDNLRADFSGFHVSCGPVLAEGEFVCTRWSVECTHKSGKTVRATGLSIVQIRDGQFIEAWQNYDEAGIAAQLAV